MAKNSTKNKPANNRKRATSYDVAELAGVSQSAVSRCFKPGASVSKKTRAKIEKASEQLRYQPNAIARGLITRRSNIVAVIITELTNLYYPELLSELNRHLTTQNIRILLFTLRKEGEVDDALNQVWQYQVDGIIAAASFEHDQIEACRRRNIPLVFFNRVYADSSISSVCCDHEEGERQLVNALLKDHRKNFLVITGPMDSSVSTLRTRGALEKINETSSNSMSISGDYSYESGQRALRDVLEKNEFKPDAIVCANDTMAIGCIDTLRHEYNIRVPEEIAVVGFDGVTAAGWASYKLTTIEQPISRMAEASVNMLVELIEDPELPAEKRLFAGKLISGSSTHLD